MGEDECFICHKHRLGEDAEGGVLYEDDLVYVGHIHTMDKATAYRAWLMVDVKRHVAGLGDLTEAESATLGRVINRVARLQKQTAGAEHVYAFIYGDGVPHLHVHLAPRYPGTPRAYWGPALDEWPAAPRVGPARMRDLISSLREGMSAIVQSTG